MKKLWKWGLPALLVATMVSACGGDGNGGNGGGSTGGGSGGEPGGSNPPPVTTISQAIAKLEGSGEMPVLDRSASLAGTDANADGVRDDIARHIDGKSDTQVQKNSLKSFSRALSTAMTVDLADQNALRGVANTMNTAVSCIWKAYPSGSASPMVREIEKLTVNTRARYDAYMKFNSAMDGTVLKNEKEVNCG